MTLLAVERIKLFTTRSPWWCMLIAVVLTVGFAALFASQAGNIPGGMSISFSQAGYNFGLIVMMVMAALAVTTEYRFGTIRATFMAVPGRTSALLAKTAVVALVCGVIGEITAFASWGIAKLIAPGPHMALSGADAWRNVAGVGLIYLITGVIAVAVGVLIRQTAGAVALLLVYNLLVESLIQLIPHVGPQIQRWMPFHVASNFLGSASLGGGPNGGGGLPVLLNTWGSLGYFAGFGALLLIVALVVAKRRDA
jgi:ABC-2 type transport system permease protein